MSPRAPCFRSLIFPTPSLRGWICSNSFLFGFVERGLVVKGYVVTFLIGEGFSKTFVSGVNFWINQSGINTWNYVWTSLNCWFSATFICTFPLYFKSQVCFYSSHWIKTVFSLSNLIQSFHKNNSSNNIFWCRDYPEILNLEIQSLHWTEGISSLKNGWSFEKNEIWPSRNNYQDRKLIKRNPWEGT